MATKVILIGKPSMGKTTIKKVVFEGENPNELVLFPLEATIGTKYSVHEFMDIKISLVDTPGQSMPILLEDEDKQTQIFEDTNIIIYIFDYAIWITKPQEIVEDIKKIYKINESKYRAKIYLYLHKIDLIDQKIRSKLNFLKTQITNKLTLPVELPIYFTSLHPDLIYSIYNALSDTLSGFSPEISKLKDIVNQIIIDLSRTICLITNQGNNIIIQEMTNDFDISLLHQLHEKINYLSHSFEATSSIDNNLNLIDLGSKVLYLIIDNISDFHSNLKTAIFLSETIGKNDLDSLMDKLKIELSHHYK